MNPEELDRAIVELMASQDVKVPPFPAIASQLSALVACEDTTLDEMASVVSRDQVIAATVLRYANSVHFAGARTITSLREGILRLGVEELHRIAWAASLGAEIRSSGPFQQLAELIWRHSVTSAFISHLLANERGLNSLEAFTCGLLHRLGRSVALGCIEQLVIEANPPLQLTSEGWFEIIDRYELELGMVLAAKWKLPPMISEIIARSKAPEAVTSNRALAELVAAADEVVELLEKRPSLDREVLSRAQRLRFPLEVEKVLSFLPSLPERMTALLEPQAACTDPKRQDYFDEPATTLEGPIVTVETDGALLGNAGERPIRIVTLAPQGLAFQTSQSLVENSLVRILVKTEPEPFEIWVTINLVVPRGDNDHRVEARLYGIGGEQLSKWTRLIREARITAASGNR